MAPAPRPARRRCSGRRSPPCAPSWPGSPPSRPTVLALEDLHWADPTSLRLTAELAELAADRPLLLIATSRPGPHALPPAREIRLRAARPSTRPRPWRRRCSARSAARRCSPARVLASTDGNPLFLEERLAEMLEAGTLVKDQGAWRLREPGRPPLPAVARAAGPVPGGPAQPGRRRRDPGRLGARHRVHRRAARRDARHHAGRAGPGPRRADRERPGAPRRERRGPSSCSATR